MWPWAERLFALITGFAARNAAFSPPLPLDSFESDERPDQSEQG